MLRRLLASALAVALVTALVVASPASREVFPAEAGPVAGEEWSLARRAGATPGAILDAVDRARELGARTELLNPALAATPWTLEGPHNVGGRVVDLALDPRTPNLLYVATASGGVWRSADAGITFEPSWPHDLTQSMGALGVSADGEVLYAGTGEANPGGGSLTYPGTGVYRSTDGGRTWAHAGLEHSARIGRIAVDPRDGDVVLAAVAGDLFTPGGVRGIYRSEDAGRTWERTLEGANGTTGGIDIVVDPTDPDRVFAALWDHRREPHVRRYGGPGSSVWRSLDGGVTWSRLTTGLPTDGAVGRIGLAVSPQVAGVVYADIVGSDGWLRGIYASTDGGNTWTRRDSVGAGGSSYEWWFGRIWVDPLDPLHLFRGSVDLQESLDGGRTWVPHTWLVSGLTGAPALHADQHAMVWDTVVPGRVFLGNDGGVYVGSLVPGGGWVKGGDQPWTQFYSVDVAEDDPSRIVGGAQDNGVLRSFRYPGKSPEGWNRYVGGDGEAALISPANHDNVYGCSQYGACARSTTAGELMSGMSGGGGVYNWFSPLEFDPSDPSVMYWGSTVVRRSQNGGGSWIPISPPLPRGTEMNGGYPFGTITTIAVSPADPGALIAGTDDGAVWIRAAGAPWTDVSAGLPGLWVSRVAFDRSDPQVAYAAMSGYRAGDGGAHVYRTDDAGVTWRGIGADLPPAPVNDLVPTPHGLLAATDVGVFVSADPSAADAVWLRVGDGLPLAPITDIRYHARTDTVYAATFGRGIWKVSL